MTEHKTQLPKGYNSLLDKSKEINFTMCSDELTGSFLKTIVSSKPGGNILELGTGTGLALSWILSGADQSATVTSIDNDPQLTSIASSCFADDSRVEITCKDGNQWILEYDGPDFDVIFADAWPGKFDLLDETLDLLSDGGIYVIDDLKPQPNWPEGHHDKVTALIEKLEAKPDLSLTKIDWSTGLIVATKKNQ